MIVIDVVKIVFVENCDTVKIDVIVILNEMIVLTELIVSIDVVVLAEVNADVKTPTLSIEGDCKATSTNLNVVRNFLFRRVDDLLIRLILFFLVSSRCSNFFTKFRQLFKYDKNFHSLNFES